MAYSETEAQLLRENEALRQQIAGASGSEAAELQALREWKAAILGCVRHYGQDKMQWGGDKDGWGAVFEWISYHLKDRIRLENKINMIQQIQFEEMPEPWRTRVCDVIANGVDRGDRTVVEPRNITDEHRA